MLEGEEFIAGLEFPGGKLSIGTTGKKAIAFVKQPHIVDFGLMFVLISSIGTMKSVLHEITYLD